MRAWRVEPAGEEPELDPGALADAMRRRRSIRDYSTTPLPHDELAELVAWSEAPIPADVPRVVRQVVTVAAVEGLEPGIYDASLELADRRDERELREAVGFAAMEQEHPRDGAVNVFQMADLDAVVGASAIAATAGHNSKRGSARGGCRSAHSCAGGARPHRRSTTTTCRASSRRTRRRC